MLNAVIIGGTVEQTRDGKALTVGRTAGESGTAVANSRMFGSQYLGVP